VLAGVAENPFGTLIGDAEKIRDKKMLTEDGTYDSSSARSSIMYRWVRAGDKSSKKGGGGVMRAAL